MKTGDVVYLTPTLMTIETIENGYATCAWFEDSYLQRSVFRLDKLTALKDEEAES